ncbi:hypothetical protein OG765_05630 [Streptomyces sp. NBC_00555]|nr:hypothetical protein [Streptomyces sp. NBC_00555]MCX5010461.1 hypothetical protein [Streptomyces sp. NBC_00555]
MSVSQILEINVSRITLATVETDPERHQDIGDTGNCLMMETQFSCGQ